MTDDLYREIFWIVTFDVIWCPTAVKRKIRELPSESCCPSSYCLTSHQVFYYKIVCKVYSLYRCTAVTPERGGTTIYSRQTQLSLRWCVEPSRPVKVIATSMKCINTQDRRQGEPLVPIVPVLQECQCVTNWFTCPVSVQAKHCRLRSSPQLS